MKKAGYKFWVLVFALSFVLIGIAATPGAVATTANALHAVAQEATMQMKPLMGKPDVRPMAMKPEAVNPRDNPIQVAALYPHHSTTFMFGFKYEGGTPVLAAVLSEGIERA